MTNQPTNPPTGETVTGEPVAGFPLKFSWNTKWAELFDRQIEIIRLDIARARFEDNLVAYLSCPISKRGGSIEAANIDVSEYVARSLQEHWGDRLWVLNPSRYQMESKTGRGLIYEHAAKLGIDISALPRVTGGDYLRMWTKILVEDGAENLGYFFDFFYFLNLEDSLPFFGDMNRPICDNVEQFLSRKIVTDFAYKTYFEPPYFDDNGKQLPNPPEEIWKQRRADFIRFYSTVGGVLVSKGSHDEWNIWQLINAARRGKKGVGSEMPAFTGKRQLSIGEKSLTGAPGYAVP